MELGEQRTGETQTEQEAWRRQWWGSTPAGAAGAPETAP